MTYTDNAENHQPVKYKINTITFKDLKRAIKSGIADFFKKPFLSLFFGIVYAAFGLVFFAGLLVFVQIWLVIPAGVGFPLIAPFIAAGLYEMSRKYKRQEGFTTKDIFTVIFKQQRREFGWMAFVVLFVFWIWIYQARLLLALFLQWQSFSSLEAFITILTTTQEGALFLIVGTIVGAAMATILFSITVVTMPLLLDREIDFVSAMLISIQSVRENFIIMLLWAGIIGGLVLISLLPAFLGLIITLPVLGHISWHIYELTLSYE